MKTQVKKCGKIHYENRKISIAILCIIIGFVLLFACCRIWHDIANKRDIAFSLVNTPEPEVCALCGNGNGMSYTVGATIARMPRDTDPIEEFERFLRETAKIMMAYSQLNSDGQEELRKRLDELTRLDEFMAPDMLSRRARLSETQNKK